MKKSSLLFIVILLIAFFLRIWKINQSPPELFGDELDVGYHAYSILKTGKDYYGQFLPSYIHSFSEWRAPLLMYATVPFITLFGLNEWGVRLPSIVFGLISISLLYFIIIRMTKNIRLAMISSFFMAISPWHLQYSRASFEVSLLLMLILLGILTFYKSFEKGYLLIVTAISFALTFYTYSTANIFTPFLILLLIFLNKDKLQKIEKKFIWSSIILFIILIIPIAYNIAFGHAADRFQMFGVFSDETIISEINLQRKEAGNGILEVIYHNKPLYFFKKILTNYASSFSPQFLFILGDPIFRHSIYTGEFYWIILPLIILGIFVLIKYDKRVKYFWLGYLLISPVSSALTKDGTYHATRLILMLPPLIFIASLGLDSLLKLNWKLKITKSLFIFIGLVLFVEFSMYLHQYYLHYPKESWRWWHVGYKESMQYMKDNENSYNLIILNNTYEPALIRFLFWWEYPPKQFLHQFEGDKPIINILPGFDGFKLGEKYYFGSAKDYPGGAIAFIKAGNLYLVSQRDEVGGDWDWEKNPPENISVLKTIRNPYGEPIFYVVTGK